MVRLPLKPINTFSPLIARNLYDYVFLPHLKNKRVLDFCSGFGGRLIGFWVSQTCSSYVGIDPNPKLIEPYHNLVSWLESTTQMKNKKIKLISSPAEDLDYIPSCLGEESFDIIFTSPPYFNREIYNDDDPNQSISRYPELTLWRDNFLFPVLKKCCLVLSKEGVLAINIKQLNTWKINIVDDMCNYLTSTLGLHREPNVELRFSLRPGTGSSENIEYVYVFKHTL